jgi:hypothetical protein
MVPAPDFATDFATPPHQAIAQNGTAPTEKACKINDNGKR